MTKSTAYNLVFQDFTCSVGLLGVAIVFGLVVLLLLSIIVF
jgi:hypothetical protein